MINLNATANPQVAQQILHRDMTGCCTACHMLYKPTANHSSGVRTLMFMDIVSQQ